MDFDRIDKLKRRLYSRKNLDIKDVRSPLFNNTKKTEDLSGWSSNNTLDIKDDPENSSGFLKKFAIFAFIFFIISIVLASYIFFFKNQFVSSNNVDILISGPTSVSAGSDILLSVSVLNKNQSDIESAVLTTTFPDGSVLSEDQTPLKDTTDTIGTIQKGESINRDLNFSILGNKDSVKTIEFKFQYRIKGSNAVFVKQKKYDLSLDSSPVILNVSSIKEISSGQNLSFKIDVTSNSTTVLKNLYLKAEYPYGFEFSESNLKNSISNNEWFLGDLKNGDKKSLTLSGKLFAQNNEERTFRFFVGPKEKKEDDISSVLTENISSVTIKKPFFEITSTVGGAQEFSGFGVADSKSSISPSFYIENTLNEKLYSNKVEVFINSPYVNKSTLRVGQGGFYNSLTNTIVWDKNSTDILADFDPLARKGFSFQFDILDIPLSVENPKIDFTIKSTSLRSPLNSDTEEISSSITKTIKVKTLAEISPKTLYGGPIASSGPNPPQAEKATTYNLDFNINNKYNDLSNATLSIILPAYVTFTGKTYPSSENISYNENTREVLWTIGSVSNGAGFINSSKKAGFQVKIIPSLNQINSVPNLTSSIVFSATDSFTGVPIKINTFNLTTENSGFSGLISK